MSEARVNFPFSAIVDQERLRLALLLNAVNPLIGGLLVRGPKGSGKSVGVRALGDLLPEVEVVADCVFNCSPNNTSNMCSSCRERFEADEALQVKKKRMRVITLPLGSTEDRVVGTLDMEKALRGGVKALQPGILAEANQNILYVDEINLLPDHIVDDLLDAAASGWNVVERESISIAHPSRFVLIGTMNPEEGELRPQLLDRLPISVTLHTIQDVDKRVEIVKRNLKFMSNPPAFTQQYSSEQDELRRKILKARELMVKVAVPDSIIYLASDICSSLEVDGQRPDIIMAEVAKTIAALNGRSRIAPEDVLEAAKLALNHRTRKGGFEGPPTEKEIDDIYRKSFSVYRHLEAMTLREDTLRRVSQTPARAGQTEHTSTAEPELESKSKMEADRSKAGPLKEDKRNHRSEKAGRKGLGALKSRSIEFPSRSPPLATLEILLALVSVILLGMGLGVRFHLDLLALFAFLSLLASLVVFLLMRTKFALAFESSRLLRDIFSSSVRFIKRGIATKFSVLQRRARSSRSELLKGVPLAERLMNWFGSRSGMLPDLHVRRSRRSFLAGKRGISLTTLTRGRYRFYEKPSDPRGDIALFPTIQTAVMNGHVNREAVSLVSVQPEDLRTKVRVYRAPVTMVLLLDVSESMIESLKAVAKAVSILNAEAYRKRDRLAVIAFKGSSAYVLNHPTTNINVVAGKIRTLKASGNTPLAQGMLKALEVVKNEKRRNRNVIPLVVLISDFFPNIPLKGFAGYMLPQQSHILKADAKADAVYVARLLKQDKIPVISVCIATAPSFQAYRHVPYLDTVRSGYILAKKIAEITNGRCYLFEPPAPIVEYLSRSTRLEQIISRTIKDIYFLSSSPASPLMMQLQPGIS